MNNFVLLVNCCGSLLNPDDFKLPGIAENCRRPDIVYKLHINTDFVRFIKRFENDIDIVFYDNNLHISQLQTVLRKSGLIGTNTKDHKFTTSFMGPQDSGSRLDRVVREKYQNGKKYFIVLDTNKGFNKLSEFLETNLKSVYSQLKFFSVYTRLFTNSGKSFSGLTYHMQPNQKESFFFADSVTDISNFLACLLSKPEKAEFFYYNEDSKSGRKRYYLFDYYPIGEGASVSEPFSREIFRQIKESSPKSGIPNFFCSAIANSIMSSGRPMDTFAFVLIPSHTAGTWNPVLSEEIKKCLIDKYNLVDSRFAMKRIMTIPRQSTTKHRSIQTQIPSLCFDIKATGHAQTIVLLDDITTSGISVDACTTVIRNTGYKGQILSFAVGGTQSQLYCISPLKYNVFSTTKPKGDCGYIFDLDGTLLDSSISKPFRDNGKWKMAYSQINQMRPFPFVVAALRELISKGEDVAIVTSSISRYCYNILHHLKIETDNITIVCYHDSNKHKPDAEPYRIALQGMAHDNSTIVCIGDEIADMVACENLGKETGVQTVPVLLDFRHNEALSENSLQNKTALYQCYYNEIDFLYSTDAFYPELNKGTPLYQFTAKIVMKHFTGQDFFSWLINTGLLIRDHGQLIPSEIGEITGICLEHLHKTTGEEYTSLRYSINAQKEIFKKIASGEFDLFLQEKAKT